MREVNCSGSPFEVRPLPRYQSYPIANQTVGDWPATWHASRSGNSWRPRILQRILSKKLSYGLEYSSLCADKFIAMLEKDWPEYTE